MTTNTPPDLTSDPLKPSSSSKAEWRREIRARRVASQQTNGHLILGASSLHALRQLPEWQHAEVVASFLPTAEEIDPGVVDRTALKQGKQVAYPRVIGPGTMEFCLWAPGDELEVGPNKIRQPSPAAQSVPPEALEFLLVPLLACDQQGNRLGYGGGYYDRVLARTGGFRCGVGFDFQRVAVLPSEEHDQPLDGLLTAAGLERFTAGRGDEDY